MQCVEQVGGQVATEPGAVGGGPAEECQVFGQVAADGGELGLGPGGAPGVADRGDDWLDRLGGGDDAQVLG